jgi:SAM-dependent methyltransferase
MSTYDDVPYPSVAYPQAHPDRMHAIARIFGIDAAPVENARVLEIGCGSGAHLASIAATLPSATCVGVDPSAGEIARARWLAEAASLHNVTFHAMDAREVEGTFDYVVAHGVISWVDSETRRALWATARRCLSPNGVFYASYNVHPGWYLRGAMRDVLRMSAGEDVARARALLAELSARVEHGSAWRAVVDDEVARLGGTDDAYVFHEHLERENHPLWFRDARGEAEEAGLSFVSEAEPAAVLHPLASPRAIASLRAIADDVEHAFDLVRGRSFRCSLFALQRPRPCAAAGDLVAFARGADDLAVDDETSAVLAELGAAWPDGRRIDCLSIDPAALLPLFAAGVVELRARGLGLAPEGFQQARATSLARAEALRRGPVSNLRGEPIPLSEVERQTLVLLDGRPRAEVAAIMGKQASDEAIERLRRLAFLLAP